MESNLWPALTARVANSRLARWIRYDGTLIIYRLERSPHTPIADRCTAVGRDDWSDLEKFESTLRWLPRSEFLRICEQRLAAGEHVYTLAANGRLLAYGWLVPIQVTSWFPAVWQSLTYPPRSAVLYNAFTHPSARGLGYNTLLARERIADAFECYGAQVVHTAVESHNEFAIRAKHSNGMVPWLELSCRIRFGRREVRKSQIGPGPAPSAPGSASATEQVGREAAPLSPVK